MDRVNKRARERLRTMGYAGDYVRTTWAAWDRVKLGVRERVYARRVLP